MKFHLTSGFPALAGCNKDWKLKNSTRNVGLNYLALAIQVAGQLYGNERMKLDEEVSYAMAKWGDTTTEKANCHGKMSSYINSRDGKIYHALENVIMCLDDTKTIEDTNYVMTKIRLDIHQDAPPPSFFFPFQTLIWTCCRSDSVCPQIQLPGNWGVEMKGHGSKGACQQRSKHKLPKRYLIKGTVPRTVVSKEWQEETEKKFQSWPRVAGPPVVMNPIRRQNFIVKASPTES
eukprot:Gb_15181 [translate_table: standard]